MSDPFKVDSPTLISFSGGRSSEQIMGLVKDKPERAIWWAKQEQTIGATFRSDRASYSRLGQYIDQQADMFNAEGSIECFCGD